MNKYIKIAKTPTSVGIGGTFSALASFKLDNINFYFNNVNVKIDTGCSISTITLKPLNVSKTMLKNLKSNDILNGNKYMLSYGVETGGTPHSKPVTYDDKMQCTAMKFEHAITNFELDGMMLSHDKIYVNYDRSGNILIGMDILENWDIHIGKDDTGETIFLACPLDQINDDYLRELKSLLKGVDGIELK